MKLIDKDALVAEIERQKAQWRICKSSEAKYRREMLDDISSFINTLEVKEVDFDAEWKRYFEHRGEMATVNVKHLAKHFFEFGISVSNKAQKGE